MKKLCSPINIKVGESVQPSPEDITEGRRIENDPAAMLRLVDLIFGPGYQDGKPAS
jgi:hypothetical protein